METKTYIVTSTNDKPIDCITGHYDWSTGSETRILDISLEDGKATVTITCDTAKACDNEIYGQWSDGIFENIHCTYEEVKKYWYAIQKGQDDNDWGTGSYDLEEARVMALRTHCTRIAVIDESGDGLCVEEIEV